jgi:3-oxoacyl-[acyl-carrier-protein] synthase II
MKQVPNGGIATSRCCVICPRIVVTGIGVVSPVGRTAAAFWHSLTSTRDPADSAADDSVRQSRAPVGVAEFTGRIDDFCDLPAGKRKAIQKSLKLMNRETQMGVAAGQQALQDSGLAGGTMIRSEPESVLVPKICR